MYVDKCLIVAKKLERLKSEGEHGFIEGVKENRRFHSAPERRMRILMANLNAF